MDVKHSVFADNSEPDAASILLHLSTTPSTFEFCSFDAGTTFDGLPSPAGSDGNRVDDPEFLGGSGAPYRDRDLHLSVAPPLIDAGDPTLPDPDGSPADLGAWGGDGAATWDLDHDGSPSWWQPGAYDVALYPAAGWDCDDLNAAVFSSLGCE